MIHLSALNRHRFQAVRHAAGGIIAVCLLGTVLSTSAQTAPGPAPVPRERVSVQTAFARVDNNHDGRLSRDEAARLPAIADKFDMLDLDKDQFLNPEEFAVGFNAPV